MSACRPVPVWARSVFGARSLVWSVVWVLRADGLAVVDCLCACGLLEFSGFVVSQRLMVGCLPVSVWTGSDFGVCSPIRSTGSGGCVVGGLMVGAGPAGGLLEFSGFWCGGWLVSACWLALVWTGSVFGSRSRVWSVVWVLRADRRAVFDCCVIGWPLEFRGFGVVSGWWLFAGRCRCGPDRF